MQLTVVGAGLTGLVGAIEAAEHGWSVTVLEARSSPGGRAGTLDGPYRANRGPHAFYTDGPLWSWLEHRGLTPSTVAPCDSTLFRTAGRVERSVSGLHEALAALPPTAPINESFREWLGRYIFDPQLVEALTGLAFVVTYDHDPGRLSANFVHDRLRRGGTSVRYIRGGWARLIDQLIDRALALGVHLRYRERVHDLPVGPTIIATTLPDARSITKDPSLSWPGTRAALFDFGFGPAAPIEWFRVFDLDRRIYAARYSEADPSLAPPGHHLIQIGAALTPGEPFSAALARVKHLLDTTSPGWEDHLRWRRRYELTDQTGAVDLPGSDWLDRPAVVRSRDLAVASDASAAPGLFSEVAHNAVRHAISELSHSKAQASYR
jgi:phytoene dehydrogenase-like protein